MSDLKRKKLSGSEYKKKRLAKESQQRKLCGAIEKFVIPSTSTSLSVPNTVIESDLEGIVETPIDIIGEKIKDDHNIHQDTLKDDDEKQPNNEDHRDLESEVDSDPASWRNLNVSQHQIIIEKGPIQVKEIDFPKDESGRHFSDAYYYRIMSNGEKVHRKWLIYSKRTDAVFCFCCLLFKNPDVNASNWSRGYKDWKNICRSVRSHESCGKHMECFKKWKEMDNRLKVGETIDEGHQRILNLQRQYWRDILNRIIAVIQLCGSQMLPLRGTSDKLFEPHNGNFLKIMELLSKFDPVTREHLRRASAHSNVTHYLGKNIQNNIISLLGKKVRDTIIAKIKRAKYYSIILDCTPDVSKIEQMSLVIRIVSKEDSEYVCKEYFINFLPVESSSGAGLTELLIKELNTLGLEVGNIRGQGYDNGANMKGMHSGVQRRILNENPKAFFVPCSCHSLNLVVNDAAKNTGEISNYFSQVQDLFVFFSASTQRWSVLKKYISSLTLKSVSATRWESRIEAIKPLRYQLGEIYDALVEISLDQHQKDADARTKSGSLASVISSYKFICSTVVWHDILFKINMASKLLQSPNMVLSETTAILKNITAFLKEYRLNGFKQMLSTAGEIAEDMEISPEFTSSRPLRIRRKTKLFEYEEKDDPIENPEKQFEVGFFNSLVDIAINSVEDRFHQLESHSQLFEFLYDISALKDMESKYVLKRCDDLQIQLTNDIDSNELHSELLTLSEIMQSHKGMKPLEVLNYLETNSLTENFPNIAVSLRILLTIPVSVATGERSFSKLKLIKNYLRSTMTQDRLTDLAILTIEHEICASTEFDDVIDNFAKEKCRKVAF